MNIEIIAAAHLPIVVALTLYLNPRCRPRAYAPGSVRIAFSIVAILSYGAFSLFFFVDLPFL